MIKIKEGFVMRNIVDEWIIVPIGQQEGNHHHLMTVNETGHMLWEILEKGATVEQLIKHMLEEYDVDEDTAKTDIEGFINTLQEHNII